MDNIFINILYSLIISVCFCYLLKVYTDIKYFIIDKNILNNFKPYYDNNDNTQIIKIVLHSHKNKLNMIGYFDIMLLVVCTL